MDIFTSSTDKDCKYKCEKLGCNSEEHKIVKNFYDKTTVTGTGYHNKYPQPAGFNVYKIIETNVTKTLKEKRSNLMLFHGTSERAARGILTSGFKNSEKGWFGKGVYMTDCSNTARYYSKGMYKDGFDYVFVNEVVKSQYLQTFRHGKYHVMSDCYTKPNHPFEKHVFEGSQKLTEAEYKEDAFGRKYRNVSLIGGASELDEYVADQSFLSNFF